jgi:glutamate/tyrosine decarboxylase-like PLP-dependent enzyme
MSQANLAPLHPDAATRALLHATAERAADYLDTLDDRHVGPTADGEASLAAFDHRLPEAGADPADVLDDLATAADAGIAASGSPRYFGFVIGGTLPVALAADWLTATWDQLTGLAAVAPATSAIEQVTGRWLLELFGLSRGASFAFVTGCQMAHVTGLAAARHSVLSDVGWDVERDGLVGAPAVRILVGAERHVTVDRALRLLGFGEAWLCPIEVDERGAMRPDALTAALRPGEPTIVCAQAGNLNTGAVDPLAEICDAAAEVGAWVHGDGAFGLWAAASRSRRNVVAGAERLDSWATDAHKWLNVPYDCGMVFVKDAAAHRAAIRVSAAYLIHGEETARTRDPVDWTPEFSRRARAVPVYAALRALGRSGVEALVDRLCACAERFADRLAPEPGVRVLASGLNQVLVRFDDDDAATEAVIRQVQDDGTAWMGATTWQGRRCMRISVSSWRTTVEDVDRTARVVLSAHRRSAASAPAADAAP